MRRETKRTSAGIKPLRAGIAFGLSCMMAFGSLPATALAETAGLTPQSQEAQPTQTQAQQWQDLSDDAQGALLQELGGQEVTGDAQDPPAGDAAVDAVATPSGDAASDVAEQDAVAPDDTESPAAEPVQNPAQGPEQDTTQDPAQNSDQTQAQDLAQVAHEAAALMTGQTAAEKAASLYALLADVPLAGDAELQDADAAALAALQGSPSTREGISRAFALIGSEAGLTVLEVRGADNSTWCMVEADGAWRHADPAVAQGATDTSWLMLTDDDLAQKAPAASPWTLLDGGEAPKAEGAQPAEDAIPSENAQSAEEGGKDAQQPTEGTSESQDAKDAAKKADGDATGGNAAKKADEDKDAAAKIDAAEAAKRNAAAKKDTAEAAERDAEKARSKKLTTDTKAPADADAKKTGTMSAKKKTSISTASVTVATATYSGKAQKPKVTVKYHGRTLKNGTDYSVSHKSCVNAGTYDVVVRGKGSFSGSKTAKFKINRASVARASVSGIGAQPYTGKAICPKPAVKYGKATLKQGRDYALGYKNNTKAGTATVTITGKGNYSGTKSASFKIVAPSVQYYVHRQTYGWEAAWSKSNGQTSGTTGERKRLEGIKIRLNKKPVKGSVQYKTHVQTYGWQGWKAEGAMSGTTGQRKRLEAIQIKLTGEMAKKYDVYYRVHAQKFGWMGWAKNGASAGTAGYSRRLEAIQIKTVPKGAKAPGSTANAFRQHPNVKAHAAYLNQVKAIARANTRSGDYHTAYYKYANVYGDTTDELLVATHEDSGSNWTLRIYRYANGSVKQMLQTGFYGDLEYRFYRQSDGFTLHSGGHGGELYTYYSATGGSYKQLASRGRKSKRYGSQTDGPWSYTVYSSGGSRSVSKSRFDSAIRGVEKGTPVKLGSSYTWTKITE